MLNNYSHPNRIRRDPEQAEYGFPAETKEAVQGDIRMPRIPEQVGRREVFDICKGSQHHANETLSMSFLKPAGSIPAQFFVKTGEKRIHPRLRNLNQKTLLVNDHGSLQLRPGNPAALIKGNQAVRRWQQQGRHPLS